MTLINLSGEFKFGMTSAQTGINIREQRTTVEPEYREMLPGLNNEIRGGAIGAAKKTVSISGEVATDTGIMAATFIAGFAPANSSAYFGAPATVLLMTRAEVTESRSGWKDLSADFEAYAGIATV